MNEALAWIVPSLVVFGSAAVLTALGVVALRAVRRSPKALSSAEADRVAAGSALVRLDDEVSELSLEAELSGALHDGTAPAALRRANITATRVRDSAFDALAALGPGARPAEVHRVSTRILRHVGEAERIVRSARDEHTAWATQHADALDQVTRLERRAQDLRAELGDSAALIRSLGARFDETEFTDTVTAATVARAALDEADERAAEARARAQDPTRLALPSLADAERALRHARAAVHAVEEGERLLLEASTSAETEWSAAREALREATALRDGLDDASDAEVLGSELRVIQASLGAQQAALRRRPVSALHEIAVIRDRLDLAVGDARTAQQRLRNARTALTGAVAVARAAIAHAQPTVAEGPATARVRLAASERELATATSTTDDPVSALDAARRATRHAEDALALANYAALTPGPRQRRRPGG